MPTLNCEKARCCTEIVNCCQEIVRLKLYHPLTHNFPYHEDQADDGGNIELPPCSLLGGIISVARGPAGVAVLAPLQAQLNGGEVGDVAKHGSVQVLLRDSQVRPEPDREDFYERSA